MTGAERIAAERQRQIRDEGYTPEHDSEHVNGELARAATCYAERAATDLEGAEMDDPHPFWPWDEASWKPSDDPIINLQRAGALIAAEIDRLLAGGADTGHTSHACDCGHHWDIHMAVVGGCSMCSCNAHPPNQPAPVAT